MGGKIKRLFNIFKEIDELRNEIRELRSGLSGETGDIRLNLFTETMELRRVLEENYQSYLADNRKLRADLTSVVERLDRDIEVEKKNNANKLKFFAQTLTDGSLTLEKQKKVLETSI